MSYALVCEVYKFAKDLHIWEVFLSYLLYGIITCICVCASKLRALCAVYNVLVSCLMRHEFLWGWKRLSVGHYSMFLCLGHSMKKNEIFAPILIYSFDNVI